MSKNIDEAKKFLRQQSYEQLLLLLEQGKEDAKDIIPDSEDHKAWLNTVILIGEELDKRAKK